MYAGSTASLRRPSSVLPGFCKFLDAQWNWVSQFLVQTVRKTYIDPSPSQNGNPIIQCIFREYLTSRRPGIPIQISVCVSFKFKSACYWLRCSREELVVKERTAPRWAVCFTTNPINTLKSRICIPPGLSERVFIREFFIMFLITTLNAWYPFLSLPSCRYVHCNTQKLSLVPPRSKLPQLRINQCNTSQSRLSQSGSKSRQA